MLSPEEKNYRNFDNGICIDEKSYIYDLSIQTASMITRSEISRSPKTEWRRIKSIAWATLPRPTTTAMRTMSRWMSRPRCQQRLVPVEAMVKCGIRRKSKVFPSIPTTKATLLRHTGTTPTEMASGSTTKSRRKGMLSLLSLLAAWPIAVIFDLMCDCCHL